MITAAELKIAFPQVEISTDRSYRDLTSLGVGRATLPLLAEPGSQDELSQLLKYLYDRKISCFIFGAGTNLVGMDRPYNGVGIRLSRGAFTQYKREKNRLVCGAFVRLPMLAQFAADEGLKGLGALSGIPGSLGGAVHMNAGANGTEIGSMVVHLQGVADNGTLWEAERNDVQWCYRGNSIPANVVITQIILELEAGEPEELQKEIEVEIQRRKQREPAGRSAGCAFRNVSDLEPAGKLIDQCGLRGFRVGDLLVSEKHANYILNVGNASEADYLQMIQSLRRAVAETYGYYLRTEIEPVDPESATLIERTAPAPKVNVLYGGNSSERLISLQSGSTIATALRNAGFRVQLTDIQECSLLPSMLECDVIYPALHGGFGEGGALQRLLELSSIHFVGSGSVASELIMDKIATKRLLELVDLPTARWQVINRSTPDYPENLQLPLMIKVPDEGSSVGIVKVNHRDEWPEALAKEFALSDELLVEEFISGIEITIPILNGNALEAIEITSPTGFYDWDAKYEYKRGETAYYCPPQSLSKEVIDRAREIALKFYHAAGSRDLLRVDFIVTPDGTPMILEGNSLPGNTAHSLVPKAARHAGISLEKMTSTLVYAAMKRSGKGGLSIPTVADKPSSFLIKSCRWMFRFTLLSGALLLFALGLVSIKFDLTGWTLIVAGFLMLISEGVFTWFEYLEKK